MFTFLFDYIKLRKKKILKQNLKNNNKQFSS